VCPAVFGKLICSHYAVKHLVRFLRSKLAWPQNAGMKKSTFSPEYECVMKKLIEMRKTAGLTNRQLAEKLDRENSFVWRIEHGERRLDVVEFFWVCEALGQNAKEVYGKLADEFRKISR
jgi:hypothetical protein